MSPEAIDYSSVSPADLELVREPRKSTFTVVHKPTGTVGATPVVPGTLLAARFRRPSNLPKETKKPGLEGYIESVEESDTAFFFLYEAVAAKEGQEAKPAVNEYLDKLATDPEALKATFEGTSGQKSAPAAEKPAESQAPAAEQAETALGTPAAEAPVQPPDGGEQVVAPSAGQEQELDDLLSTLET